MTPLGHALALLPMNPQLGKMLLYGVLLGCLDSALTVACAMAYRSPFVLPMNNTEKAQVGTCCHCRRAQIRVCVCGGGGALEYRWLGVRPCIVDVVGTFLKHMCLACRALYCRRPAVGQPWRLGWAVTTSPSSTPTGASLQRGRVGKVCKPDRVM